MSPLSAFQAIEAGDMGRFMMSFARGVDPNARDERSRTLLIAACEHPKDRQGFVEHLLDKGAHATTVGPGGQTALHAVCRKDTLQLRGVELMLEQGVAINQQDNDGKTALHALAERGWAEGCMALLDACPRPLELINQVDHEGRTPLWHASGHPPLVCFLVSYGADPRIVDKDGVGPMAQVQDSDARAMMFVQAATLNRAEAALAKSAAEPDDELSALMQQSKAVLAKDYIRNGAGKSTHGKDSTFRIVDESQNFGATNERAGFEAPPKASVNPDVNTATIYGFRHRP